MTKKEKARREVRSALLTGRLTKPNRCNRCGKESIKLHGHHSNYNKPLKVVWLCPACHVNEHHPPIKKFLTVLENYLAKQKRKSSLLSY